jgi:hypothetical protein
MLLVLALAGSLQEIPHAVPVAPIDAILEKFQSHSVVALGEGPHGDLASLKFRLALIRDPRFSAIVNDIVVEAGNARYQDAIDRYVRGEDVPATIVREACRNTTNENWGSDFPSFEEIFHAVRALNLTLPPDRRLRLLLGDPPFDWAKVKDAGDLYPTDRQRFVADLILRESVAKKRRTLIVYGDQHLRRDTRSIVSFLEAAGQKVFNVWTTSAAGLSFGQSDVTGWAVPSLSMVKGTRLGAGEWPLWHPLRLEQRFDAVLNLGVFSPGRVPIEYCADPEYMKMRLFRMDLRGRGDELRRYCGILK